MALIDHMPEFMKKKSDSKPSARNATIEMTPAPPPATVITPGQPILRAGPGNYQIPLHDDATVDKIFAMVTATVPAVKDLLAESDKIADKVPDQGTRFGIVMKLRNFSPAQAADAARALVRALETVKRQSDDEAKGAYAAQVEKPLASLAAEENQRTSLQKQITAIQADIAAIDTRIAGARESAEAAKQKISVAHEAFTASAERAKTRLDELIALITNQSAQ